VKAVYLSVRRRTGPGVNATAVIWKTLLIAERAFRRLDAPELLAQVAEGVVYVNGERVKLSESTAEKKAAV
jgi:hypothetical protein